MEPEKPSLTSRRQFLARTGGAAASVLAGVSLPAVHAQGSSLIRVALIGCGGRGSGAAYNALSTKGGPIQLVAMADAYEDRLKSSYLGLSNALKDKVDVPEDRRFVGFDAYKHAMDCLKPGDVAIFATPPAFRWVHFQYALQKGLHVFMEKPVTVDGPTSKRMLQMAEEATAKNLKVGVGLMSRHARNLQELQQRVQNGELGEILLMRGYRMHGPVAFFESRPKPPNISELEYQVRRFHSFLWASGGAFSDFYIHIIDHLCWMKNAWPVKAQALGGRHYKTAPDGTPFVDQNFDTYSVEYVFADGTRLLFNGRCINGAEGIYSSYLHGTKGFAIASRSNDCGGPSAIYRGQDATGMPLWQSRDNSNPYQNEWDALISAIRNNKPFNELKRGVEASVVTSMGRMAAHTGREITYEQMLNCPHEFAPGLDRLTADSPAPLQADAQGRYPVPKPGILTDREY
ncbi:MAG: Gfo/Idh/MocA family oxidoreductase [Chloroherpetonaceae bacterium]|nr:Gfo/Idh/MocA family oxidoreductase [Chthonomonadaceae bacterium]MDW8208561.1 Gfo/Idh/MocA family oxidoreductase [Chloroherpetonaceae bacterium]